MEGPDINIDRLMVNNQIKTEWKRSSPIKTYSKKSSPTSNSEGKSRYGRSHKPKLSDDFLSTDRKVSQYLKIDVDNQMHYFKTLPYPPKKDKVVLIPPGEHTPHRGRGRPRKNTNLLSPTKPLLNTSADLNEPLIKELSLLDSRIDDMAPRRAVVSPRYSSGNGSAKLVDLQAPAPTSTQTLPLPTELMTFKEEIRGGVEGAERVSRPGPCSDDESLVEDADWNPGDLAWANINGFPYWPCTLTKDPDEHVFKKTKMIGKHKIQKLYLHVRFFGDRGRRSWVGSTHVMPFQGLDAFQALVYETCTLEVKKRDPRMYKAFSVMPSLRKSWMAAVSEAESLMESPRSERILYFQNLYPLSPAPVPGSLDPTTPELSSPNNSIGGEGGSSVEQRTPKKRGRKRKYPLLTPTTPVTTPEEKKLHSEGTPSPPPITSPITPLTEEASDVNLVTPTSVKVEGSSVLAPACTPQSGESVVKRKRGRPRKHPLPDTPLLKTELVETSLNENKKDEIDNNNKTESEIEQHGTPARRWKSNSDDYDYVPYRKRTVRKSASNKKLKTIRNSVSKSKEPTVKTELPQTSSSVGNGPERDLLPPPAKKKRKHISGFEVYTANYFDKVSDDNPHLSPVEVERYLEKMWNEMTEAQKAKYRQRITDDSESGSDAREVTPEQVAPPTRSRSPQPIIQSTSKTNKRGINLFSGVKADKVCQVCLKGGDILKCRGSCMGYYHIECAYKERKKESVENSGQKKGFGRRRKSKPPPPPQSLQENKVGVESAKAAKVIGVAARRSLRLTSREEEEERQRKDNEVKEGDLTESEENSNEKIDTSEEHQEEDEVSSENNATELRDSSEKPIDDELEPMEVSLEDKTVKETPEENRANGDKELEPMEVSLEDKTLEETPGSPLKPLEESKMTDVSEVSDEVSKGNDEEMTEVKKSSEECKEVSEEIPEVKEDTEGVKSDDDCKTSEEKKNETEVNKVEETESKVENDEGSEIKEVKEELKVENEKLEQEPEVNKDNKEEKVLVKSEKQKEEPEAKKDAEEEVKASENEEPSEVNKDEEVKLASEKPEEVIKEKDKEVTDVTEKPEQGSEVNEDIVATEKEKVVNKELEEDSEVKEEEETDEKVKNEEEEEEEKPSESPLEIEKSDKKSDQEETSSKNSDTDNEIKGKKGWMCKNCSEGNDGPCFVCKEETDKRVKCGSGYCGKVYHIKCALEWPQSQLVTGAKGKETLHCPQHACHTCISDNPQASFSTRFISDKLVRCVRCPATYHHGNYCIPAGTEILSSSQIICPKHYVPSKKGIYHVNAAWCFICAMGVLKKDADPLVSERGTLICCDLCPNSFHAECLKISPPEGSYICEDCETGRYPLYGEIVWVKLGAYRWWPAQILYPQEVPDNIKQLPHSTGEFAVKFFGSHDHYWVNRGRVFLYHEGDGGKVNNNKTRVDEVFLLGVKEASIQFAKCMEERATREAYFRPTMKPPKYVKILSNKMIGGVRSVDLDVSNLTPCECDPDQDNPCGPDSDCLNRLLMVECDPQLCPAGERCCNQNFEKKKYPELAPFKTEFRGWGLKTLQPLKKGDFVIEYVGEMIDEAEYQRRLSRMQKNKDENYYFLTIDKDRMLDAGPKGNMARFMNHSCNPNCETQKWTVNGDTRVGLFALCDIPSGNELVFNYNLQAIGNTKMECKCGAPNCVGFIGAKHPKTTAADDSTKKKAQQKRRSRKMKTVAKVTEDNCFTCGEGGELLLCDQALCPKAYHLTCLGLTKHPAGGWVCPWHQCSVCSASKVQRCTLCINSYCAQHAEGNISLHRNYGLLCFNHNMSDSGSDWSDKVGSSEEEVKPQRKRRASSNSNRTLLNGHCP